MKITKRMLKRIIKEELESVVQENERVYDASRELAAIMSLLNKAAKKSEVLQSNVYGKGYSNEEPLLGLVAEIYRVARIAEETAGRRGL